MRLPGVEKMGFFPTPPTTLERIAKFLAPSRGLSRLLDPCAGEGIALAAVANYLQLRGGRPETYGVEPSFARAEACRLRLDHIVESAIEATAISNASFGMLYLNPPYDTEAGQNGEKKQRLEYRFLQRTLHKLQEGGVLVYIVPVAIMTHKRCATFIHSHFDDIRVYRLPDGEFETFHQVVLFGVKSSGEKYEDAPLYSADDLPPELPEEPDTEYVVPAVTASKALTFRKDSLTDEEVLERSVTAGAHQTRAWKLLTEARDTSDFQPVVPLKIGHVAGLIASGQMGVAHLGDLLAKGRTYKEVDREVKRADGDEASPKATKTVIERDRFVTNVVTLNRYGEFTDIKDAESMDAFLTDYGEQIGRTVSERYAPMYAGPTPDEWHAMAGLMKGKRVPGRKELGLFTAQKHCAIAMNRCLDRQKTVTLVGEMGTGKTAASLAAAYLRGQWPILVIAPPHLVDKWAAEVTLVIPGAKGFVIDNMADLFAFRDHWTPGDKWVAVLSKERAKLGGGWQHAYRTKRKYVEYTTITGLRKRAHASVLVCPRCGQIQKDEDDNEIILPDDQTDAELKKYLPLAGQKRLTCTAPKPRWKGDPLTNNSKGTWIRKDADDNPYLCGEPLWVTDNHSEFTHKDFFLLNLDPRRAENHPRHAVWEIEAEKAQGRLIQGQDSGMRRWPVADYIHDHMDGFFKILIADEVHEYKGKSTAQAQAYHALVDACDKTINLTGTIFNGKSTSLFWLLYRNDPAVRRLHDFNGETQWSEVYGRLERTIQTDDDNEDDAVYSTKGKARTKVKEIPGISPKIFGRLLPNTIFLRKSDLGWKLPPYREEIVKVEMGEAQAEQYGWMYTLLLDRIKQGMASRNKWAMKAAQRLLSVWLMRSLGRPNSAFRREVVLWKELIGDVDDAHCAVTVQRLGSVMTPDEGAYLPFDKPDPDLPQLAIEEDPLYLQWQDRCSEQGGIPMVLDRVIAEHHILPKEERLLEIAADETRKGNRVLVFCNQTGRLDIQERLRAILSAANLKTVILPQTVSARSRGAWIDKHAPDMQVMICNPEAVKTGLDLVAFNRIIFYEPTYNLITLQQAMNRIYRIGQERDTKIYFMVYENTIEEAVMKVIGQKIKAAALLYGENAASAIAEDDDSSDLREELISRITAGETLTLDGVTGILVDIADADAESAWTGYQDFEEQHSEDEAIARVVEADLGQSVKEEAAPQEYDVFEHERGSFFEIDIKTSWANWLADQKEKQKQAQATVTKVTARKAEPKPQLALF